MAAQGDGIVGGGSGEFNQGGVAKVQIRIKYTAHNEDGEAKRLTYVTSQGCLPWSRMALLPQVLGQAVSCELWLK